MLAHMVSKGNKQKMTIFTERTAKSIYGKCCARARTAITDTYEPHTARTIWPEWESMNLLIDDLLLGLCLRLFSCANKMKKIDTKHNNITSHEKRKKENENNWRMQLSSFVLWQSGALETHKYYYVLYIIEHRIDWLLAINSRFAILVCVRRCCRCRLMNI